MPGCDLDQLSSLTWSERNGEQKQGPGLVGSGDLEPKLEKSSTADRFGGIVTSDQIWCPVSPPATLRTLSASFRQSWADCRCSSKGRSLGPAGCESRPALLISNWRLVGKYLGGEFQTHGDFYRESRQGLCQVSDRRVERRMEQTVVVGPRRPGVPRTGADARRTGEGRRRSNDPGRSPCHRHMRRRPNPGPDAHRDDCWQGPAIWLTYRRPVCSASWPDPGAATAA
jgi:hypothetical protein